MGRIPGGEEGGMVVDLAPEPVGLKAVGTLNEEDSKAEVVVEADVVLKLEAVAVGELEAPDMDKSTDKVENELNVTDFEELGPRVEPDMATDEDRVDGNAEVEVV